MEPALCLDEPFAHVAHVADAGEAERVEDLLAGLLGALAEVERVADALPGCRRERRGAHRLFERVVCGAEPDVAQLPRGDLVALDGVAHAVEGGLRGVHPGVVCAEAALVPLLGLGAGDRLLDGLGPGLDELGLGVDALVERRHVRLGDLLDELVDLVGPRRVAHPRSGPVDVDLDPVHRLVDSRLGVVAGRDGGVDGVEDRLALGVGHLLDRPLVLVEGVLDGCPRLVVEVVDGVVLVVDEAAEVVDALAGTGLGSRVEHRVGRPARELDAALLCRLRRLGGVDERLGGRAGHRHARLGRRPAALDHRALHLERLGVGVLAHLSPRSV